jgi:hypothetical protein
MADDPSVGDQIRSLIPGEVTAVFLALDAIIPNRNSTNPYFLGFFVILMVTSIFYTKYVVGTERWGRPVLVSVVVFPAWALMIAYERIDFFAVRPFIPSGILLVLGLIVPIATAVRSAK